MQPIDRDPSIEQTAGMTNDQITITVILLGVLLIGNVFYALKNPIGWVGVILLVTGIFGICPLYSLLGLNTKSTGEKMGLK